MEYIKQIWDLESEAFRHKGGLCQITIDMIQDTEMQLNRDESEKPIERDEVGAIVYQISILLDVFNPIFTYDIEALERLKKILEEWRDEVEFINRTLGIPLERG